jgi:hypothetical protein
VEEMVMKINYSKYINYFSKKEKPKNILSNNILNEYSNNYNILPQAYKDVEKEYSQINISKIKQKHDDIISMIYWDMAFLSEEFICYCLPKLILYAVERKDITLLDKLKNMNLEILSRKDSIKIIELIKKMEVDNRFK